MWHISCLEWFETNRCFITIAFQLCFKYATRRVPRRVQTSQEGLKLNGTPLLLVDADVNMLGEHIHIIKKIEKLY